MKKIITLTCLLLLVASQAAGDMYIMAVQVKDCRHQPVLIVSGKGYEETVSGCRDKRELRSYTTQSGLMTGLIYFRTGGRSLEGVWRVVDKDKLDMVELIDAYESQKKVER